MRSLPILCALLVFSAEAQGGIFKEGIRFFEEPSAAPKAEPEKTTPAPKAKPFSWSDQLDIEKDQFFKEGDYIPPAPLIEALRRPTKENIENFEKWQAMRNLLLERYEAARLQYVAKNGASIPRAPALAEVNTGDINKYRYLFYFESTCPHCHAMFQTINEMVRGGAYVEAIRIDKGEGEVRGLEIPWSFAKPDELKKLNVKAVPVLVAIDEKTKRAYQMTGKKTVREILQVISRGAKSAD